MFKKSIKNVFKNSQGVTLIELLLVIAVISALGILSASFYSRFLTQNAVSNTSDQIVSSLRKAQLYSMSSKESAGVWGVKFTSSPRQITLFLQGNPNFDEDFSVNSAVSITGSPFDTTGITFAHLSGIPSASPNIVISGQNNLETVVVNSQGVISKQ